MRVLLMGPGLFALAFCAHVLWWRVRLPRRQTRTLVMLFLAVYAGASAALWLMPSLLAAFGAGPLAGPGELVHGAVVYLSLLAAYVITYSAVEADSPSLVIVQAVAHAGMGGIREDDLRRDLNDERLIDPRLRDLVRDGLALEEDGSYRLMPKGARLAAIIGVYRALLGASKGG